MTDYDSILAKLDEMASESAISPMTDRERQLFAGLRIALQGLASRRALLEEEPLLKGEPAATIRNWENDIAEALKGKP
jgi:hypothetical protein